MKVRALAGGGAPSVFKPRDIVSIRVSIEPVLDLTDRGVIDTLKVDAADFLADDETSFERCHLIADFARAQGYLGMVVPSAAKAGEKNLIIFIDGPAYGLDLEVGPDRMTI